LSLFWKEFPK